MLRKFAKYMWLGSTLAVTFFYPLIADLYDTPYYLHWQSKDNVELILAWLMLTILFSSALWVSFEKMNDRPCVMSLCFFSLLPFASMGIHILRQIKIYSVISISTLSILFYLMVLLILLFFAFIMFHPSHQRWMKKFKTFYITVMAILSTTHVLFILAITSAGNYEELPPKTFDMRQSRIGSESDGRIYIFLFDEMSYEFLYHNNIIRDIFPHIATFSSDADNYHSARAPGKQTLNSIPGLLIGKSHMNIKVHHDNIYGEDQEHKMVPLVDVSEGNLFSIARNKGLRTHLYGVYFQYNNLFKEGLDESRSISLYNFASTSNGFSPLNPIATSIILWPLQYPFGLLKQNVYAIHHRRGVERIFNLGKTAITRNEPSFVFLHFMIPHVPFVFDVHGFRPGDHPYEQNVENYTKQLQYVDTLFGRLLALIKKTNAYERATIIVLSDHNYRKLALKEEWDKIPLIIKRKSQHERRDVHGPVESLEIIRNILSE